MANGCWINARRTVHICILLLLVSLGEKDPGCILMKEDNIVEYVPNGIRMLLKAHCLSGVGAFCLRCTSLLPFISSGTKLLFEVCVCVCVCFISSVL